MPLGTVFALMLVEQLPVDVDAEARRIREPSSSAMENDAAAKWIRRSHVKEGNMAFAIDRIGCADHRRDMTDSSVTHDGIGISVNANPNARGLTYGNRLERRKKTA